MRAKFFEKEQKTERYFQQVLMPNLVWNQLFSFFYENGTIENNSQKREDWDDGLGVIPKL